LQEKWIFPLSAVVGLGVATAAKGGTGLGEAAAATTGSKMSALGAGVASGFDVVALTLGSAFGFSAVNGGLVGQDKAHTHTHTKQTRDKVVQVYVGVVLLY
jgi:hypothetical protein